jgi:type VI protein secretion system component Hcp
LDGVDPRISINAWNETIYHASGAHSRARAVELVLGTAPTFTAQMSLDGAGPTPLINFSLGGTNSTFGVAPGGGGSFGKVMFSPLNVTKMLDGFSVLLLTRLANGNHFTEVKIEAFGPGNALLATYKFGTAFVLLDLVGSSTMSLVEQVQFTFGQLESDINVNGTVVHSCWDSINNRAC